MNLCQGQGHENHSERGGAGGYGKVGWVMVGSEFGLNWWVRVGKGVGKKKKKLG